MTTDPDRHACCWHSTNELLMSHPPQLVQVCCWCGEKRHLPVEAPRVVHGRHGTKVPDL